jgi:hypothetical protein
MSNPIESTPPLEGEDAVSLLEELEKVHLSPEQVKQRVAEANERIAETMRPKGFRR